MTTLRNALWRFASHPTAMRFTMAALVLAGILLPMGPVDGGGGGVV